MIWGFFVVYCSIAYICISKNIRSEVISSLLTLSICTEFCSVFCHFQSILCLSTWLCKLSLGSSNKLWGWSGFLQMWERCLGGAAPITGRDEWGNRPVGANLGPSLCVLGQEICLAFKVASRGITYVLQQGVNSASLLRPPEYIQT